MRIKMLLMFFLLFFAGISLAGNQYFLDFDGVDDCVYYPDDATLESMNGKYNYTIEAWVYIFDDTDNLATILRRDSQFLIYYRKTYNSIGIGIYYSGAWKYYHTLDNTITTNEWHHIAVIRNNTLSHYLHIYIDGVDQIDGSWNGYGLTSSNTEDLYIARNQNGDYSFKGYIDEIRFKNVAEDPSNLHYHKNDPEYESDGNTAALFHFDEGTGQTTKNAATGSDAYLGTSTPNDAAEPTWRVWNYNGSDLSLPVELTAFSAFFAGHAVLLQWQTASEVENLGFIIERALQKDGPFSAIASYRDVPSLKGAGNSSQGHHYSYSDKTVQSGTNYWYRLQDVSYNGSRQTHGPIFVATVADNNVLQPGVSQTVPRHFKLYANYPNPFNPDTRIKVDIPQNKDGNTNLKALIFDVNGQQVRSLYNGAIQAGSYQLHWDGKDDAGRPLGSGVYILSVKAGTYFGALKMTLMR